MASEYRRFLRLTMQERDELLADALDQLSEHDLMAAVAIIKVNLDGMGVREHARDIGCTPGAVSKRVRRGLDFLHEVLMKSLGLRKEA